LPSLSVSRLKACTFGRPSLVKALFRHCLEGRRQPRFEPNTSEYTSVRPVRYAVRALKPGPLNTKQKDHRLSWFHRPLLYAVDTGAGGTASRELVGGGWWVQRTECSHVTAPKGLDNALSTAVTSVRQVQKQYFIFM
jgi:hypothetical protein